MSDLKKINEQLEKLESSLSQIQKQTPTPSEKA